MLRNPRYSSASRHHAKVHRNARDQQVLSLFTYDLREYKQVPDWLNAKFWANPENFGKYWW
jgi:hypothetical protein